MTWNDQPAEPVQPPSTEVTPSVGTGPTGLRKSVLTAGMAAALLIVGGVAAASAASPDQSATPAPAATDDPVPGRLERSLHDRSQDRGGRENCDETGSSDGSGGSSDGSGGTSDDSSTAAPPPVT